MKLWKEYAIAFGVALTVFVFALQETSVHARRPEVNQAAEKMANWAIESDKRLTKDTLRMQALVYDRRLQELRKLAQSPKTKSAAGAYARSVIAGYYEHKLEQYQKNRTAIDTELGAMSLRGVSEELVMARFEDLTKPWRETEAQMTRAKALTDDEAISSATTWLKNCYEQNMKASGLRGDL